jgi:hypothetical protein
MKVQFMHEEFKYILCIYRKEATQRSTRIETQQITCTDDIHHDLHSETDENSY